MYRALISFVGKVSMAKGEVRELNNEQVIKDLLRAGYIEKLEEPKTDKKVEKVTPVKKTK